ncbi:MAG: hypothetical protein O3C43_14865 [Verrucomicrobia bacterium]|nr:hypothetical protein [Verrucomicrobiota bacterium]
MKKKKPDLPPEEWAFFVKKKEWLVESCKHCWIPEEELLAATQFEYTRVAYQRGLHPFTFVEFKEFITTPYVSLLPKDKNLIIQRVQGKWSSSYPQEPVRIFDPYYYDPENDEEVFEILIDWSKTPEQLKLAFENLIEKIKPTDVKPEGGSGNRRSERDLLSFLAALRLKERYGPSIALSKIHKILSVEIPERVFYGSSATLINAANKAEDYFQKRFAKTQIVDRLESMDSTRESIFDKNPEDARRELRRIGLLPP